MPHINKKERYVSVAYELRCGCERATALTAELAKQMKGEPGFRGAKDDTRGWDGDRMAVVVADYNSLPDAVRLDPAVRRILSQAGDFTYQAHVGTAYGSRGAHATVTAATTFTTK